MVTIYSDHKIKHLHPIFFLLFLVFFLQHRIIIEMFYCVETLDQISATLTILWKFLMDRCAFTLGMNDILLI